MKYVIEYLSIITNFIEINLKYSIIENIISLNYLNNALTGIHLERNNIGDSEIEFKRFS